MLHHLPEPVRAVLWRAKHAALSRAHDAHLAEYHQGFLARLFGSRAIDLVIDVGANTGQFARMVRRVGYAGPIVSFEPIPANVALLAPQARRDRRWDVRCEAVDVTPGTAAFNCMAESTFSSLLQPNDFARNAYRGATVVREVIEVPVVRLDATPLPDARHIHLKVDTQGTDLAVVRSAAGLLDRVDSLSVELGLTPLYERQASYLDAVRELEGLGFRVAGVFPVTRDRDACVVDADFVFVRTRAGAARAAPAA